MNWVDIPGEKARLNCIGVRGPGFEESWNFLHTSLKQLRVELIRGCSFKALRMWQWRIHGIDLIGRGEKESSRLTQSLKLLCTVQSTILPRWHAREEF